jgi:hypothetical protein
MSMKSSAIASALVGALLTSTVTTRAEELIVATMANPQAPLVARSLKLNTQAVNVIQQPGAPANSSGPQMAPKKKVLIWLAILGAVFIMMLELKSQG